MELRGSRAQLRAVVRVAPFLADGRDMNTEHEVIGYDKDAGKLRFTRIHEDGTVDTVLIDVDGKWMRRHWEYRKTADRGCRERHRHERERSLEATLHGDDRWEDHSRNARDAEARRARRPAPAPAAAGS